jgi:phenylalanyl-tRNA synthetase beta chain
LALLTDTRSLRKEDEPLDESALLSLKEAVIQALGIIDYAVTVEPLATAPAQAHPGRAGTIRMGDKVIGSIYELHPEIRTRLNVHPAVAKRVAICSVNLSELLAIKPALKTSTPVPMFPAISFDENLELEMGDVLGPLMQRMKSAAPLLESVEVVDLYKSPNHKPGASRATLRFTYRATEKTLTEDEAKREHEKVLSTKK